MVRIWRVETGEPVVSLDGRSQVLPQVFLSADGRMLAAAGYGDNHVRVWDMDELGETASRAVRGDDGKARTVRAMTDVEPHPSRRAPRQVN